MQKSFLLVALLCAISLASAIHEDEQGLRDWLIRTSGDVKFATVAPVPSPHLVYVASTDGAVTAIDTTAAGASNLTWRVLIPEEPLCIAASTRVVLVSGRGGTVLLLNPKTGALETTFKLSLPAESTAAAAACLVVDDRVTIAMHTDGGAASLYSFAITAEEEFIQPVSTIETASPTVLSMRLAGEGRLWVNSPAGVATEYDVESGAALRERVGACASVARSGEAVVVSADALAEFASGGDEEPVKEVMCSGCGGAVVVSGRDHSYAGLVQVTSPAGAVEVSFVPTNGAEGASVTIPFPSSVTNAFPLISFTKGGDAVVLVKTGSGHLLLVSASGGLVWERMEALGAVAAALIVNPAGPLDHFHFNKEILLVSRHGTLYNIPLADMGHTVTVITDFSRELTQKFGAVSMRDVKIKNLGKDSIPTTVVVRADYRDASALVKIDLTERRVTAVDVISSTLLVSPEFYISKDLSIGGVVPGPEIFTYVAHASSGKMEGFHVSAGATHASPTWSLQFPYPIVVHAFGADELRTTVVNSLRVYKNMSGKENVEEVRHMYPMRNVIAVAYYEPLQDELPTLVTVAIDAVTGGILGTARNRNVEGAVHMVIADNAIISYFLDAEKMRYVFSVWELFEEESGAVVTKNAGATLPQIIASFFANRNRVFSSRASRPPVIVVSTLGAAGGPVAAMGVTTSPQGIAHKGVVLAFESGRVVVMEVARLLAGGQMPMGPGEADRQVTHAVMPSITFASHKYRIAFPRHVTTEPTGLESSCHVVVSGLDLFYVRSSSGKAFDLLNSDFNKPLLVTLVCLFAGLSVVVRWLVTKKTFNSLWR